MHGQDLRFQARPDVDGRFRRWVAFSPLFYLVHDLEELATARAWVAANWQRIPEPWITWLGSNTDLTHVYAVAISILLVAMGAISVAAAAPRATRTVTTIFAICVMLRLANGLLHAGLAAASRGYVPGLITALVLVLPYSAWLMSRLVHDSLVRREAVHVLFILGLLLQIPVIATVLLLATIIS